MASTDVFAEPELSPSSEPVGDLSLPESESEFAMSEGMLIQGDRPWYLKPDPDWAEVATSCGIAWDLHKYGIGTMYLGLGFVTLVSLVLTARMKKFTGRGYYLSLQALMSVGGFARSVHFFGNAYNSTKSFPSLLTYILFDTSDPCILSSFILVFSALMKVTRLRALTRNLFHPAFIATVIVVSFVVTISADVIVVCVMGAEIYMFVCKMYFIICGLVASVIYLYLFCRLYNRLYVARKKINRLSRTSLMLSSRKPRQKKTHKLRVSVKETYRKRTDSALEDTSDPSVGSPTSLIPVKELGSQSPVTEPKPETPGSHNGAVVIMEGKMDLSSTLNNENDSGEPVVRRDTQCVIFEPRVPLGAKLVLLAACTFLVLTICNVLAVIVAALRLRETENGAPEPWYWWGYQTTMRLLELHLCATIVAVAAMPLYAKQPQTAVWLPTCAFVGGLHTRHKGHTHRVTLQLM